MAAPEPSCRMKKVKIRMMHAGQWMGAESQFVGCAPLPGPAVTAPADLRSFPISAAWQTMRTLILENGNTEYLPPLPATLVSAFLQNNKLKELPDLPAGLQTLNVNKNQLKTLPALPPGLRALNAKHNLLSEIPSAPPELMTLHLTHNQLTELPSLASTQLTAVGIGFNRLRALPALPRTLRTLGCGTNELTEIKNLPSGLRVLNCSNNQLRTLQIEKCKVITHVIATNCGLTEIPVLPEVDIDDEDNYPGPDLSVIEDRRQYFFDNNPLTPEFAAIYQRYKDARGEAGYFDVGQDRMWFTRRKGSTYEFRRDVLEEHRRIIAQRASSISAILQTFKGPMRGGPGTAAMQQAMQGNFGPTNLIAQFITGHPGTIERQRLALLGNKERLGMVPRGTAKAARKRIADVVVGREQGIGPNTEMQNYLRKRAKLYVRPENITAAKARFEKEVKRKLEEMRIADELKKALLIATKFSLGLRVLISKATVERNEFILSKAGNNDFLEDMHILERLVDQLQYIHFAGDEDEDIVKEIVRKVRGNPDLPRNPDLQKYLGLLLKIALYTSFDGSFNWHMSYLKKENVLKQVASLPQMYTEKGTAQLQQDLARIFSSMLDVLTDEDRTEDEAEARFQVYLQEFLALFDTYESNEDEEDRDAGPDADAAIDAVVGVLGEEDEEEDEEAGENPFGGEGGKRRHHSTPRRKKAKRQTRKQEK